MGKKKKVEAPKGLSTGSALLNLACTDDHRYGFLTGKYYFFVGDTSSGKTALSLTCLAEAALNPDFKDYRLIYDDVENGNGFNVQKLFGTKLMERIEPPARDKAGEPQHSCQIEEFYYNVDNAIKDGRPFIYILDSETGLSSEAEKDKFEQVKEAHYAGKTTTGSYGDGKAKKNSSGLRRLMAPLRDSGSILLVICQTRDNISPMSFETKTRSGGRALAFYASLEMWTSKVGKIKKTVKAKPRQIGIQSRVKVKKNRVTGRETEVDVPIYYSYGIDDIGSCVDFLISEKHWTSKGGKVEAPELGFGPDGEKPLSLEKLCQFIDSDDAYVAKLHEIVQGVWNEVRDKCQLKRRQRYE